MAKKLRRRPYIIISITAVLAVLVFVFVYIEVNASRNDLLASKRAEATTLIETFVHGTEASIAANNQLEELLVWHLRTAAKLIRHEEGHQRITSSLLAELAESINVSLLAVTDAAGDIQASNIPLDSLSAETRSMLDSIFVGTYKWITLPNLVVPALEIGKDGQKYYALALVRKNLAGSILIGLREDRLLGFRMRTGVGKLIQDLGKNILQQ